MTLHTLSKSPDSGSTFAACLRMLNPGDGLLLIQDGVYGATSGDSNAAWMQRLPAGVRLYVLQDDLAARGVQERLLPSFEMVDYAGFVELTCHYPKTVSWF